ncbi:MAG: two-component sensor histidine kinase, partial [Rhizobiales bacterium]|nr:two-component sensor histidine kinase [Hyphomicrobiales bacterium]
MTRLIDDLLSLSRVELNAHRLPVDPVDLAPLVVQMAESLMTLAKERGVTLNLFHTDRPFWVAGDADELSRVVENLTENAIKYGQAGGRVDVTLSLIDQSSGGQDVCLEVREERFYRVDVSQSREKGGTGLGLALVKHIVSHHRGRLQIDSQTGQGAVFRVLLPHKTMPA